MKATTDDRRRTFWAWCVSVTLHVVLFAVLIQSGILKVDLSHKMQEAQLSQAQLAEQEAHNQQRRAERQKRELPKTRVKQLKRDAEQRKRRDMLAHVEQIRAAHENIKRIKKWKLDAITQRTNDDIQERQLEAIIAKTESLAKETRDLSRRYRHPQRDEIAQLAKRTRQIAQTLSDAYGSEEPEQDQLGLQLSTSADQTESAAKTTSDGLDTAGQKAKDLGYGEDKQNHHLARQTRELIDRYNEAPDMRKLNDVSQASPLTSSPSPPSQNLNSKELYEMARRLEKEISEHYNDVRTAELALKQNTSFNGAKAKLTDLPPPQRFDFAAALNPSATTTIGDLNQYREALQKATQQAHSMALRAANILNQAQGLSAHRLNTQQAMRLHGTLTRAAQQAQGSSMDLSGAMRLLSGRGHPGKRPGAGAGNRFTKLGEGGRFMARVNHLPGLSVREDQVITQALPGRRFTRESARKGWLYLDTWYVIGPWENHGTINYQNVHPPETVIDFDAEYGEGKQGQVLRWQYIQSNSIRVIPPRDSRDATYYAYTELFFDEDMDMLLAIASDDATKVWINNQVVWQENGLSQWYIGEGIRRVFLKKGTNTILVRLENGPGETMFSVVVCPEEAASSAARN